MDFSQIVINGVPLMVLIVGIVQFSKELGLRAPWLRVLAAALGLLLGLASQLAAGIPADFAGWLGVVVFGLAVGIAASGLVDAARDLQARAGK